jgi:hypothetical protein
VGSKVRRWKVGDEVVIHCNQDDGDDEECNGGDPMNSSSQRIWGYETTDGSFAQFCRVQSRQLMPRPKHLTWEEAGCYTLVLATAYRMLFGHAPHTLKPGDNVLVWGGAGGLGSMAIQLIAASGGNAIAVISRRTSATSCCPWCQGCHQPQGVRLLGRDARPDGHRGLQQVARPGAQVRQGDLGHHRQGQRPRHRLRAPGCVDLPGLVAGLPPRRHGRDLRRHHRLQAHHRRPLHVDAPEADAGQPLREPEAGLLRQQVRPQPPGRPLHERGLRLGRHPARPHEDVEEPAQAREHGGAGPGQAAGMRTIEEAREG